MSSVLWEKVNTVRDAVSLVVDFHFNFGSCSLVNSIWLCYVQLMVRSVGYAHARCLGVSGKYIQSNNWWEFLCMSMFFCPRFWTTYSKGKENSCGLIRRSPCAKDRENHVNKMAGTIIMQVTSVNYRGAEKEKNNPLSLAVLIPGLVSLHLAQKWKWRTSRSTQNSLKHNVSMFKQWEWHNSKVARTLAYNTRIETTIDCYIIPQQYLHWKLA